tara:strand:- start:45 stop:296 length:252 start_codon:yes stop_codon:yes gene_type:complete
MDMSRFSVGVQSKSVYVQGGNLKGINRDVKGSPLDQLAKDKAPNVELYSERWEQGLDIWTGEPLEGSGLEDWKNQRKKHNQLE